jgi:hypothetical protein
LIVEYRAPNLAVIAVYTNSQLKTITVPGFVLAAAGFRCRKRMAAKRTQSRVSYWKISKPVRCSPEISATSLKNGRTTFWPEKTVDTFTVSP